MAAQKDALKQKLSESSEIDITVTGRKGQHSIRINDQYRICFEWRNENAYEVEITDYH